MVARRLAVVVTVVALGAGWGAAGAQTATGSGSTPPAATTSPSADAPLPTFGSVLKGLGRDVRHVPSLANGLWLAGGGAAALSVRASDTQITARVASSSSLDALLEAGAVGGGGMVQGGAALGTFVVGRLAHHRRMAETGAALVRAQMLNAVLTQALKLAVQRERPDHGRYSFPSGHTSSTAATATVLLREFGWKAGVPAYAFTAYVAVSRLQEMKHYPSDVVFGAALGLVAGRSVVLTRGGHTLSVGPLCVPGGAGLILTRIAAR